MTTVEDRSDELAAWIAEDDPDGARVLDDLLDVLTKYVVFADGHAAAAVALWIAATHAVPAFEFAPRLVLTSPEKRCAKSRTLDVIAGTCHKPLVSVNATTAAVYRSLDAEHPPTLIIDEADAIFGSKRQAEQNEDLRALLNAGHQRGRPALRCVGPQQTPTEFPTFAMAAVAGIGVMPDTITDRAVNIAMRRRTPDEKVSQFRSRRDGPLLAEVRVRLAAWAAQHIDELAEAQPKMPVDDRAADTWEPLVAVADAAAGHWPKTARDACVALVSAAAADDEDRRLSTKLLADICEIFSAKHGVAFVPSLELVRELRQLEESPWVEEELNARRLSRWLKEFGVASTRNPAGTVRGYRLQDLTDAFGRYLCQDTSKSQKHGLSSDDGTDTKTGPDANIRQPETCRQHQNSTSTTVSDTTDATRHNTGCKYCGGTIPAHQRSQIVRGYCGRTDCTAAARREATT